MDIIISETVIPAVPAITKKRGSSTFEVTDKKLVIKHGDDKLFEEKPPNGKKWEVSVVLDITETDA